MFKVNQKLIVYNSNNFLSGRIGYFQELVNDSVVLSSNVPGKINLYDTICYFTVNRKYIQTA